VAALAAVVAGGHELVLDAGGLESRIEVEGRPDRSSHRGVHVVADEIHQLERTHAEAGAADDLVDSCWRRHLLLDEPQRLAVEAASDPVDNEPWGGLHARNLFPPGSGEVRDLVGNRRLGLDA
jgi:hypothetical protein